MTSSTRLHCICGKVQIDIKDAPILSAECHCTSCRTGSQHLEALPGAPKVRAANGGTPYALYRKDRLQVSEGQQHLLEYRLKPASPTRRILAGCCNTPLFLEFQHGHWLSVYSLLWPEGTAPQLDMRTMVSDAPTGTHLDDTIPNAKTQSLAFMAKLLGAWIAMGFRSPKLEVAGKLDV